MLITTQLDKVRMIPAELVRSLASSPRHDPVHYAKSFQQASFNASVQVDRLKLLYGSAEIMTLIQACTKSSERNVELVLKHHVDLWGWEQKVEDFASRNELMAEECVVKNSQEDEMRAVMEFRPRFESCQWVDDQHSGLNVSVKMLGTRLVFAVERRRTRQGVGYHATCIRQNEECDVISRCLFKRRGQQNIFKTLVCINTSGTHVTARH